MQKFRVYAITEMVQDVKAAFLLNKAAILEGTFEKELIKESKSCTLRKLLKTFDKEHAYRHRSVLEVELQGYNTIRGLMDLLWEAIADRECPEKVESRRKTPFSSYAYNRISENYRRVFEAWDNRMPIRYKELQLLTDMISGMTDSFAISLYNELKQYHVRQGC